MKIKKFNEASGKYKDIDPYGEENWNDDKRYEIGVDIIDGEDLEDSDLQFDVIESFESKLGQGSEQFRICSVDNDLYLTYDYTVVNVRSRFEIVTRLYLNGDIDMDEFLLQINAYANAYEKLQNYLE